MSNFRPFLSTLHSLVGLQIISRLVTFGLNQSLIRIASPTVYGTAAIQFELIRETVLFLGREAVRGVILREGRRESKPRSTSRVLAERTIDLRFLPPVLGIFVIASLVPIYVHLLPSSSTSQALYYPSLSCYLASAILELTAEPAILGAQLGLFEWNIQDATSVRAKAEGLAVIARAIVTFVLILTARYLGQGDRDGYTLLGFASGQMAFSITLLAAWCQAIGTQAGKDLFASGRLYYHKGLQLCTHVDQCINMVASDQTKLLRALICQSVLKYTLTEGDKLVVGWTSPLEDQGAYAIAINYASLIVRIIFQPMEESARLYFSSTAFNEKCSGRSSRQALLVLNNLVRFSVILFIIALAFVSPTIPLLVDVILPERYRTTSAATTLVVYLSIYLPIISLNGILEAFFAATTGTQDIAAQSGVLAACSAIFGVTLLFLRTFRAVKTSNETRMIAQTKISWINPETSLVFANAAQMLCRVAYASKHAGGVASRTKQADRTRPFIFCLTPGRLTLFTATVAAVICRIYPVCFGPLQQIAVTAAMGVCCVGAIFLDERNLWYNAADSGIKDQ